MVRIRLFAILLAWAAPSVAVVTVAAHDPGAPPPTWNREVSRIIFDRCARCHRPGGASFSLLTFRDAQPHAVDIKSMVLSRRMPPWGAVKGFGEFRNDLSLTQEQLSVLTDWVDGDTPRGNNPNALPPPPTFEPEIAFQPPADAITVTGDITLDGAIALDGLLPVHVQDGAEMQVIAVLPSGAIRPLLWLYEYRDRYRHPFLFRTPLALPRGTVIRGIRPDTRILLIPVTRTWPGLLSLFRSLFGSQE